MKERRSADGPIDVVRFLELVGERIFAEFPHVVLVVVDTQITDEQPLGLRARFAQQRTCRDRADVRLPERGIFHGLTCIRASVAPPKWHAQKVASSAYPWIRARQLLELAKRARKFGKRQNICRLLSATGQT